MVGGAASYEDNYYSNVKMRLSVCLFVRHEANCSSDISTLQQSWN